MVLYSSFPYLCYMNKTQHPRTNNMDKNKTLPNITFREAQIEESKEIMHLYKSAIIEMNRNGIFQWDDIYPCEKDIITDIEKGEMVIGLAGCKLAAVYTVNRSSEDLYVKGNWQYPNSSYSIIHRLCVNPSLQNMKIGTKTINHIERTAKGRGIESIRLDCFTLNPYALRMYLNCGYNIVGRVTWRKGDFYLMEKFL